MAAEKAVTPDEPCPVERGLTTATTGWERRHLSVFPMPTLLILTFLLVPAGMTAYETVKYLPVKELTLWQSHTITIIFCGLLATAVTYLVLRRNQARLNALQLLNREHRAMAGDIHAQSEEMGQLASALYAAGAEVAIDIDSAVESLSTDTLLSAQCRARGAKWPLRCPSLRR